MTIVRAGHECSRSSGQFPDCLKAEFRETVQGIGVEPQRGERQDRHRGRSGVDWRDGRVAGAEPLPARGSVDFGKLAKD